VNDHEGHKILDIRRITDIWCLQVDAIESSEEDVMNQSCHAKTPVKLQPVVR
jgi:hypothetical protein